MGNEIEHENEWAFFVEIIEGRGLLAEIGFVTSPATGDLVKHVVPSQWQDKYKTVEVKAPKTKGGPPRLLVIYDPTSKEPLYVELGGVCIRGHFMVIAHDDNGPLLMHCPACCTHALTYIRDVISENTFPKEATHEPPNSVQ